MDSNNRQAVQVILVLRFTKIFAKNTILSVKKKHYFGFREK